MSKQTNNNDGGRGPVNRGDVYQIVTDRVISLLEAGTVPWRKPWVGGDSQFPVNLQSGKRYRGVNVWMLGFAGYSSPYWVSYKQCAARGGQVRKGEKSSIATFWKRLELDDETKASGKRFVPMLRYYNVFNVEQCDGIEYPKPAAVQLSEFEAIAAAEKIVEAMPSRPVITHNEARAYYRRDCDTVNMPKRETFAKPAEYYSTLFHELTHATAHESRVGRDLNNTFGSSTYAKEELLAEMGASYLNASAGILHGVIDNSAAYIASWLEKLRNDRKLVVSAAAAAQRATDYILGKSYGATAGEPEPAAEPAAKPEPFALAA